ncbi:MULTISPECIES: hypothetical protein [unclassified Streptomyces]|nr:hypothetical protein OG199_10995 [Streptomyces sp. NBC_01176]
MDGRATAVRFAVGMPVRAALIVVTLVDADRAGSADGEDEVPVPAIAR